MVRRFEKDDAGYVVWLGEHPDGYVLNTYMHVTSDYLILHRARCRTVNRPLDPTRSWTFAYGKTCSEDRGEVEAWALREGGRPAQPCGLCLRGDASAVRTASPGRVAGFRSLGPRAPRLVEHQVAMDGQGVTIKVTPMPSAGPHAPSLVIEGAQWLAETFFSRDPSAVGAHSYDALIDATQLDPIRRDRIIDGDITAINTTMAARTSHAAWDAVIAADDWSWLEALDAAWDLFEMSDEEWRQEAVPDKLHTALAEVQRPGLQIAVITKVLHIKRPRLIPVLDSLVIGQVGGRASNNVGTWVALMEHIREVGMANRDGLRSIRAHLVGVGLPERSLVRNPRLAALDLHTRVRAVRPAPRLGTGIPAAPVRGGRVGEVSLKVSSKKRSPLHPTE